MKNVIYYLLLFCSLAASAQNVGISVNNPVAKLQVAGTSWFQGNTTPLPAGAGEGIGIGYSAGSTGGYIFAFDYASYTPRDIWLNSSGGNVLINSISGAGLGRLQVVGGDRRGIYVTSGTDDAVFAYSENWNGITGISNLHYGVYGETLNTSVGVGVYGLGRNGVYGTAYGSSPVRAAVYGNLNQAEPGGYAGIFSGNVTVNGILAKSGGAFLIDHPAEPETKFLYHSFVESPDMKNLYDGVVVTDMSGLVTVTLPSWFEALNMDFRYQLTCMGSFAQAIIEEEVRDNRFVIRTDKPNVKVSWQVTGTRHDPFAVDNRIPTESLKKANEVGKYMYPKGYGKSDAFYLDEFKTPDTLRNNSHNK